MFYRAVVVLLAVLGAALAYRGTSPLEPKPDKYKDVPGCYVPELDNVVPVGEQATSHDCVLFKCEQQSLEYNTCDMKMMSPDCKLMSGTDMTKPYPDCCPVFQCFKPINVI